MSIDLQQLKIGDLMTPNPVCVDEQTPVAELFVLFSGKNATCVPVHDHDKRMVGCITQSDIERSRQLFDLQEYIQIIIDGLDAPVRHKIYESFSINDPIKLTAREIMTARIPRVSEDTSLATLSRMLSDMKCNQAIVVDEQDRILGLITPFDILKQLNQTTTV